MIRNYIKWACYEMYLAIWHENKIKLNVWLPIPITASEIHKYIYVSPTLFIIYLF